jgi:hypothetical protein
MAAVAAEGRRSRLKWGRSEAHTKVKQPTKARAKRRRLAVLIAWLLPAAGQSPTRRKHARIGVDDIIPSGEIEAGGAGALLQARATAPRRITQSSMSRAMAWGSPST